MTTMRHPGDVRWDELEAKQRHQIAQGWEARATEAAVIFDSMTPATRWEVVCTLQHRDGSAEVEMERLAEQAEDVPRLVLLRRDQVKVTKPDWLWHRWLTRGGVHAVVGRKGRGKSTFVTEVVSRLSRGQAMPGEETALGRPVRCLWVALEETASTIYGRLEATGAQFENVAICSVVREPGGIERRLSLPDDTPYLEHAIRQQGAEFVYLDGIGYTVSRSNDYDKVGSTLARLAMTAEATGAALLGSIHQRKGDSHSEEAAIGSVAWTTVPRITWLVGQDETERPAVCVSLTNYKKPNYAIAFDIVEYAKYELGYAANVEVTDVSAEQLAASLQTGEERSALEDASIFLVEELTDGDGRPVAVAVNLLKKAAEATGHAWATVRRAQNRLGIRARKDGLDGGWVWEFPEDAQPPLEGAHDNRTEHLRNTPHTQGQHGLNGNRAPEGARGHVSEHLRENEHLQGLLVAFPGAELNGREEPT